MLKNEKNILVKITAILSILAIASPALSNTSGAHNANIGEEEITAWEKQEHFENSDILGSNTAKQAQDVISRHITDGAYQPLTTESIRIAKKSIENKIKTASTESQKNNLKADLKILNDADYKLPVRSWKDRAYWMYIPHSALYGDAKKRPKNTYIYVGKGSKNSKQKHYIQKNKNKLNITNVDKSMDALDE